MFKNKALYVQMVNPQKHVPTYQSHQLMPAEPQAPTEMPPWIDETIKEYGLFVLKGALVLMVADAVLKTVSKTLINNLSPH